MKREHCRPTSASGLILRLIASHFMFAVTAVLIRRHMYSLGPHVSLLVRGQCHRTTTPPRVFLNLCVANFADESGYEGEVSASSLDQYSTGFRQPLGSSRLPSSLSPRLIIPTKGCRWGRVAPSGCSVQGSSSTWCRLHSCEPHTSHPYTTVTKVFTGQPVAL